MEKTIKDNQGTNRVFTQEEARDYNYVAGTFFAPAFPHIVSRIMERCGTTEGLALDLGSGPAHLAMEMARRTALHLVALDISEHILYHAKENISQAGLSGRVTPVMGDTAHIPVRNDSVDLIISRGSLFAWDIEKAFREIMRVLRPGGRAFIGLGLGSREIHEKINRRMEEEGRIKGSHPAGKFRNQKEHIFPRILIDLGIRQYEISDDDSGFWVYLEKDPG